MRWQTSHKADPLACKIADRHYNRRRVGSPQYVPPGRAVCLRTPAADALWVTSWPFTEYVRHAWPGAWINSLFRNESACLSSELIREAVAATLAVWPEPPVVAPGVCVVTFVDASKVKAKRDPGYCYLMAGFKRIGATKGGLLAFGLEPSAMPAALPALERQLTLVAA